MRRTLVPAAALVGLAGLAVPLAGASVVNTPNAHHHTRHRTAAPAPTPLWLAGKVTYQWSGNDCGTPTGGSAGTSPATCQETFTNLITASVSTSNGKLLSPLPGQQLRFIWYGDVFTPETPGQTSCTIVVTGTGTTTSGAAGAPGNVTYSSYRVSSPDCAVDTTRGPASSESLEAQGNCLSCNFSGFLGQPIRICFAAPGYTVLDNGFPMNTNTL